MSAVKYFITFLIVSSCFGIGNAVFDEEYAKKMINFAAASFIAPGTKDNNDLANKCFIKSYPNGDWSMIRHDSLQPCAGFYSDECQFLVAKSEKLNIIVFAFRGTVGKDQMDNEAGASLQDYVVWNNNGGYGKVNKYFYNATESLWALNIEKVLQENKGYKIAFTGHSLGGAIASLTALKARVNGLVDDQMMTLYTFGEPRVGDSALAQTFRDQITEMYRVIHNSDLVPHMPLCQGILSHGCGTSDGKPHHQPQEIWYNNDNLLMNDREFKTCSWTNGEDSDCSNSINSIVFLANLASDRGADMHLHYYEHKLDEYGPAGCNSAVSFGLSFIALTFLLLFNFIKF